MTHLKRPLAMLSLILFLMTSTVQPAEAKFWGTDRISDGYTYQDENGCMHHVYTDGYYVFWIRVSTTQHDVIVAC